MPTATLTRWGNSQGVIIPRAVCDEAGIRVGDTLEVSAGPGGIEMRPQRRYRRSRRVDLEELATRARADGWDGTYEPPADWPTAGNEVDWGEPVGAEAW